MAKYEVTLHTGFDPLLHTIHEEVLHGSMSASYEDGSDLLLANGCRCAHRVYERYSVIGGNRVSLSVMLAEQENGTYVSAITSGGSRTVWKINTFGENTFGEQSFLDQFIDILHKIQ